MSQPRRRLRNRLMLAFAGFAIVVASVFGLYVVVFSYAVEDQFFNTLLDREVAAQLLHHADTGQWAEPREPFVTVVADASALPDDIATILRAEPSRREVAGSNGRHYHLRPLLHDASSPPVWLVAEVSQQLVVRPMRSLLLQVLAWSGILMLVIALSLGFWLARRTSAPLSRLAALVDNTNPARFPAAFADRFPDDETGVLARALEQLIKRIHTFTEREREFSSDASHELRTPLAVIRGACEQLASECGLSVAGRQQLEHARQSSQQLEQTVASLLALSREQQPQDTPRGIALLPVLERVIVEQAPQLEGKSVDVLLRVRANAMVAVASPVLHILLSNLVVNAFAHTVAGEVRMEIVSGRLRISNPGSALRDNDFEPYIKGESSAGFGLGLSIVRRLCERHGIDLRIAAEDGLVIASIPVDTLDY